MSKQKRTTKSTKRASGTQIQPRRMSPPSACGCVMLTSLSHINSYRQWLIGQLAAVAEANQLLSKLEKFSKHGGELPPEAAPLCSVIKVLDDTRALDNNTGNNDAERVADKMIDAVVGGIENSFLAQCVIDTYRAATRSADLDQVSAVRDRLDQLAAQMQERADFVTQV
jgi:hypothetical protein